jgi:hypothetical protein
MGASSKQKGKKDLVLLGLGFSGLELIRYSLLNPSLRSITVIAESRSDFFVLEALCSLKSIAQGFFLSEGSFNTIRWKFLVEKVKRVDVDEKQILFGEGSISFDFLVLVNECRPKFLTHTKGDLFPGLDHEDTNRDKTLENFKRVVVCGNGFVALAMADYLRGKGLEPTLLTDQSVLISVHFPQEEACLLAKQFRNKGIKLLFNQEISSYEVGLKGEIKGVHLRDGSQMACELVIYENGTFGTFSWLCEHWHPGGYPCEGKDSGVNRSAEGIYVLGRKMYTGETIARDFPELSFREQVYQMAKNIAGSHAFLEAKSSCSNLFRVVGLEWVTYGDFSTLCGKDSQNFYWEHPSGRVSFRLVFDTSHFSVLALGTLGMHFVPDFVEAAIQDKRHVSDFMAGLEKGVFAGKMDPEILPMITKAFSVEFRQINRQKNPTFMHKLLDRFS